jgi:hypothetical protein
MQIVSVIVVCSAPCSGILVVGDVLEQYLVVGCVLGWCVWRCVCLQVFCLGLAENQGTVNVAPFVNE